MMLSVYVFHRPAHELEQDLPSREFDRYAKFFEVEPLPDAWLLAGTVAASNYHCHGATKTKPSDFKPQIAKRQTVDEMKAAFKAAMKGRIQNG